MKSSELLPRRVFAPENAAPARAASRLSEPGSGTSASASNGVDFSALPIQAPNAADSTNARDLFGGICLRKPLPLGGRVKWSGLSQDLLNAEVRVKDEQQAILKHAAAGTTQYDIDAVYFNEDRARRVIKVPDHCTISYEGDLDGFGGCCNVVGTLYQETFGDGETQPRIGTADEFGVPNTPEQWEKAK